MFEKRREERIRPGIELRLYDRTTEELIGPLVDFSTLGIRIKCEQPIDADAVLLCSLQVPLQVSPGGTITFDARRVWCHAACDSNAFEAGFELVNVNREEMKRLKQFVVAIAEERKTAGRS